MSENQSEKPPEANATNTAAGAQSAAGAGAREYEKSGMYPQDGSKPFRIWALLGGLVLVFVFLAGVSALLDLLLLPRE